MDCQRTIRRAMRMEGVGLHSGEPGRITLSPAAPDTGILFRAADGTLIPANCAHVVDARFATTIGAFGVRVRTIEHLMAAAAGLGVDNLLVDVEGPELPAADGSAQPFAELLEAAGRLTLPAPRQPVVIREPVRVEEGTRWLEVVPAPAFRVTYTLDHDHPVIGLQTLSLDLTEERFLDEVAPARTYGFLRDVGAMRRNGLARGGSLDNAVVVGKRVVLNASLRFSDEFVRHKVLDLVGDLFLLGRPLLGHVRARNGGHALNHRLVAAIEEAAALERRRARARVVIPASPVTEPVRAGAPLPARSRIAAV
jgi:UDP-3-O-[3-hydroxymyristoyl] N-acetylglucosamine deacetylase